jgi:hypothetical protein
MATAQAWFNICRCDEINNLKTQVEVAQAALERSRTTLQ